MGEAQNYDLFENVGATTGPDENFCRIKKLIADYERKKKLTKIMDRILS